MIDLEAIRERTYDPHAELVDAISYRQVSDDRAALLAEVDRLADEIDRVTRINADAKVRLHECRVMLTEADEKIDRLTTERDALQRRCDRLVAGDDIESDRLTATDDRLVNALAERDDWKGRALHLAQDRDEHASWRKAWEPQIKRTEAALIENGIGYARAIEERDEARAAVESLVCELPGGSIPADVAKALAHGKSIVDALDAERAKVAKLKGRLRRLAEGCRIRRVDKDWPALEPLIRLALKETEPGNG